MIILSFKITTHSKSILKINRKTVFFVIFLMFTQISSVLMALNGFHAYITYTYVFILINTGYMIMFDGESYLKFFISGAYTIYMLSIRGVALSIESIFYNKTIYEIIIDRNYYMQSIILLLLIMAIFFHGFNNFYSNEKIRKINKNEICMLILVQVTFCMIFIVSSFVYYQNIYSIWINFYHALMCFILFLLFHSLFNYSIERSDLIAYEVKSDLFEKQIKTQINNYYSQIEYIEKLRCFKHDYSKINKILIDIVDMGDLKKVKAFIKEINNSIDDIEAEYSQYSNHPIAQSLLFEASKYCSKNNIVFLAEVNFPDNIKLNDLDVCRVFDNILKNAIEACELITQTNKFQNKHEIKISSEVTDHWFTIVSENSFDGYIKTNGDRIFTRKSDEQNHGLGIKSILNVIESQNGFVEFDIDKEKRIFKILIHIPMSA